MFYRTLEIRAIHFQSSSRGLIRRVNLGLTTGKWLRELLLPQIVTLLIGLLKRQALAKLLKFAGQIVIEYDKLNSQRVARGGVLLPFWK